MVIKSYYSFQLIQFLIYVVYHLMLLSKHAKTVINQLQLQIIMLKLTVGSGVVPPLGRRYDTPVFVHY